VAVTRCPLDTASYRTCSARLKPGQVKRVMQRGPLQGYVICCPGPSPLPMEAAAGEACGFVGSYLDRVMGYVEEPPGTARLAVGQQRKLIASTHETPCFRCRRLLSVKDGAIEVRDP
jgi:hypothetical protein